jgi:hypothetical protein
LEDQDALPKKFQAHPAQLQSKHAVSRMYRLVDAFKRARSADNNGTIQVDQARRLMTC